MTKPEGTEKPYKNPTPPRPEDPNINNKDRNRADDHPGGIATS